MVVQRYRKPQVARSIRVTSSKEKPLRIDVLGGFLLYTCKLKILHLYRKVLSKHEALLYCFF